MAGPETASHPASFQTSSLAELQICVAELAEIAEIAELTA